MKLFKKFAAYYKPYKAVFALDLFCAFLTSALDKLAHGRTTITIAHRLSTIRNADEIIVIDSDGIKERGPHDELLAKNGIYARYYNMQFEHNT